MATDLNLEVPGATIVYDVRGSLPADDGRPPLLMVGQPMDATGFGTLASYFPDRTVVTYDPRGLGRSTRSDGSIVNDPVVQAEDLHRLVDALGVGAVDLFASSGGAVTSLALVAAHPDDVRTLVAHEPPLFTLLPDAAAAVAAERAVPGRLPRPRLGRRHGAVHRPDLVAGRVRRQVRRPARTRSRRLRAADRGRRRPHRPAALRRLQPGHGLPARRRRRDRGTDAGRRRRRRRVPRERHRQDVGRHRRALGLPLAEFPSHHGGFLGNEHGQGGEPEAFAARLREVLDDAAG